VGSLHLVPSGEEDSQPPASASADASEETSKGTSASASAAEGASKEAVASVDRGQLDASTSSEIEVHVPSSVCVLIPVRDGQKHLSQCLRSLLTQPQGCPFKILLIDDGSSDDTMNIALAIQKEVQLGVFLSSNPGKGRVVQCSVVQGSVVQCSAV
jgi:cellulose synthase/poly-beta-1,6-N-acetylglucosamine synthase-like glycosyltransferase